MIEAAVDRIDRAPNEIRPIRDRNEPKGRRRPFPEVRDEGEEEEKSDDQPPVSETPPRERGPERAPDPEGEEGDGRIDIRVDGWVEDGGVRGGGSRLPTGQILPACPASTGLH